MAFFRQFIAPLLIVLVFVIALVAVGARIFLPSDMAAPAPIESVEQAQAEPASVAEIPTDLETLIRGLPLDLDSEPAL
jgi:hypothetical protein